MNWYSLQHIKSRLAGQWGRGRFLKASVSGESLFPLEIVIKGPSAAEMVNNFDAVRTWVGDLKRGSERSGLRLIWKELNHRQLGRNSIPARIVFSDIAELAGFLGKTAELRIFGEGLKLLDNSFPELRAWAAENPFELIKNAFDLERLISIPGWRLEHPRPEIYLRQLSLPGVDTKFIESHRKLLGRWLDILLDKDQINEHFTGVGRFEQRYGFLPRPETVRIRFLDPDLRIGGLSDITVRADEFAELSQTARRVFIIENDITALAFPQVKKSILIFGRGYNFNHLLPAEWLKEKELWYWGDLDTHGFAILNQFRTGFPSARSFLMDSESLMSHRVHWGTEKKQTSADLPLLRADEALLYDKLRYNKIRPGLRLEQEFIGFSRIEAVIRSIEACSRAI